MQSLTLQKPCRSTTYMISGNGGPWGIYRHFSVANEILTKRMVERSKYKGNTSIFRGVHKLRCLEKYTAEIYDWTHGRMLYIGTFDQEKAAAQAYDLASIKLWGPIVQTNYPIKCYDGVLTKIAQASVRNLVTGIKRYINSLEESEYVGVLRNANTGKWQKWNCAGSNFAFVGSFESAAEAAMAFDIAMIKLNGAEAFTNFDIEEYRVEIILNASSSEIFDETRPFDLNKFRVIHVLNSNIETRAQKGRKRPRACLQEPLQGTHAPGVAEGIPPFKIPRREEIDNGSHPESQNGTEAAVTTSERKGQDSRLEYQHSCTSARQMCQKNDLQGNLGLGFHYSRGRSSQTHRKKEPSTSSSIGFQNSSPYGSLSLSIGLPSSSPFQSSGMGFQHSTASESLRLVIGWQKSRPFQNSNMRFQQSVLTDNLSLSVGLPNSSPFQSSGMGSHQSSPSESLSLSTRMQNSSPFQSSSMRFQHSSISKNLSPLRSCGNAFHPSSPSESLSLSLGLPNSSTFQGSAMRLQHSRPYQRSGTRFQHSSPSENLNLNIGLPTSSPIQSSGVRFLHSNLSESSNLRLGLQNSAPFQSSGMGFQHPSPSKSLSLSIGMPNSNPSQKSGMGFQNLSQNSSPFQTFQHSSPSIRSQNSSLFKIFQHSGRSPFQTYKDPSDSSMKGQKRDQPDSSASRQRATINAPQPCYPSQGWEYQLPLQITYPGEEASSSRIQFCHAKSSCFKRSKN